MSAREAILERLRQRLDGDIAVPTSDFAVMTARGWNREERLARFEAMITAVRGEVVKTSRADWTRAIPCSRDRLRNCR